MSGPKQDTFVTEFAALRLVQNCRVADMRNIVLIVISTLILLVNVGNVQAQLGRSALSGLFKLEHKKEVESVPPTRGGAKVNTKTSGIVLAEAAELGEFVLPTILALLLAFFAIVINATEKRDDYVLASRGVVGRFLFDLCIARESQKKLWPIA